MREEYIILDSRIVSCTNNTCTRIYYYFGGTNTIKLDSGLLCLETSQETAQEEEDSVSYTDVFYSNSNYTF